MNVKFNDVLRQRNISITTARKTVFTVLQDSLEPISMRQLVEQCKTIDRASVYRTVALFEDQGFIRRIQQGWKYQIELSDMFLKHHHHLTCTQCGTVIDITNEAELVKSIEAITKPVSFHPVNHELEITGICRSCFKK